jgi:hypothetical protein
VIDQTVPPPGWALIPDDIYHRCIQIEGVLLTRPHSNPADAIAEAHTLYTPVEEPFPAYGKTPRMNEYMQQMLITEKIDGTNALIMITPAGAGEDVLPYATCGVSAKGEVFNVRAGSRTRWLEPNSKGKATDNFGFAAWVHEHAHQLVELGPGKHYGEWWGLGIQRGYGLAEKRFSLFRWWRPDRPPEVPGLDVAPVLYHGPIDSGQIEACQFMLTERGSLAAPGYNRPEGLIVWLGGQRGKVVWDK